MLALRNITVYTPEYPDLVPSVMWLQTEDGLDWYLHRTRFQPDTVKIAFDAAGVIRFIGQNVDMLAPVGLSVIELDPQAVPTDASASCRWKWDGTQIVRCENRAVPPRTRDEMMDELERLRKEISALPD